MSQPFSKDIVISYAPSDKDVALRLSKTLSDWFQRDTWLREFDLDGGQLVIDALEEAIGEAKWFILLLSSASAESDWVKQEANLATFRAILGEAFKIIVIKLDSETVPDHLRAAFTVAKVFNRTADDDLDEFFLKVADYVEQSGPTHPVASVYVDRGEDADRFVLAARRNQILFVVGRAGVGKTAFVLDQYLKSCARGLCQFA